MWSKINEVLQNTKRLDETLYICDNGMTISDTTKILASKFNNYFTNAAQELLKKLGKTNKFRDYMKNPNEQSLFSKEAEPGEVFIVY